MPQQDGYLISQNDAGRLSRLLNGFEGNQISGQWRPDRGDFGYGRTTSVIQTVEITGAAISTGYYPGKVKNWDNTAQAWVDGPACRVREASAGTLTNGATYTGAKLVGQDTVSSVNYLVFQVGNPAAGTIPTIAYYNGGTVSGRFGSGTQKTQVKLVGSGTNLYVNGYPWGDDVSESFTALSYTPYTAGYASFAWNLVLLDQTDPTSNYYVLYNKLHQCIAQYVATVGNWNMVKCRGNGYGSPFNFYAVDSCRLVPTTGQYFVAISGNYGYAGYLDGKPSRYYGWAVNAVNLAQPVSPSGGVALPNGGAFPNGMGGSFVPSTGVSGVS